MKKLILFSLLALLSGGAFAQSTYQIYPVPHSQTVTGQTASFTKTVYIVAGDKIDGATINRAKSVLTEKGLNAFVADKPVKRESNIVLGVESANDRAGKIVSSLKLDRAVFAKEKFDRHILSLYPDKAGNANVVILGEDTDAVFCGLASLEQILDNGTSNLCCVNILDYADIARRGIIEGYYGVPYSAAVTKDLFRFMARYKMNCYMYGAKSDPYHSKYWSDPYPEAITAEQERIGYLSAGMLEGITEVARASKVDFIWAIHPGTAFTDRNCTDVNKRIMAKFASMYELGVRQFAVFVDDVGVPDDLGFLKLGADRLTELQNLIDARWNNGTEDPARMVKPLNYVPQLYAYSWVPLDLAKIFFNSLSPTPQKINIFITGANVWSVPNNTDLELVNSLLGRSVSWWWNYPCNDNNPTRIFPMDAYTNFRDEREIDDLARLEDNLKTNTLIINPMQQGEISKIALFSVADYSWNNSAFNNERSYQAAIPACVGKEYADALAFLIPHLRYFDADALSSMVGSYRQSVERGQPRPAALIALMDRIVANCEVLKKMALSPNESDWLFYADLKPWLLKLEAMATETAALLKGESPAQTDYKSVPDFQYDILRGMGEDISLSTVTAQPSEEILMNFIAWLRQERNLTVQK